MTLKILLTSACTKTDGNLSTWMPCITENWFMNSPELMAVLLYFFFAIIMYRTRMPVQIIVSSFMILSLIISLSTESGILDVLFLISMIPIAGLIFLSILRRFLR